MVKKFVPYEKASKKEKRKRDSEKRGDWGEINPATKVIPDKKKEYKKNPPITKEDY